MKHEDFVFNWMMYFFQVIVQFQPSAIPDEWGTTQDGQARPRVVKRGTDADHDEIPDGTCVLRVGLQLEQSVRLCAKVGQ